MLLEKDGVVIGIENENTAAGYMSNGWRPVADMPAQAAAPAAKRTRKKAT